MIDMERLVEPMTGDGCGGELFCEKYREPLKAACAEDGEIWQIYATNFGPEGFDESVDRFAEPQVFRGTGKIELRKFFFQPCAGPDRQLR